MSHTRKALIGIALALCAVTTVTPVRADGLRGLRNELAGWLAHPALQGASVGLEAVSLGSGETLMSAGAERGFMPASNMKLVTVATALELLGADWQCNVALAAPGGDRSLASVARRILKPSDNELAERLLAYLPVATGRRELPPEMLAGETWGERGLVVGGMRWEDGSGLSRRDLLTPEFTVRLLSWMRQQSRWWPQFRDALPVSGVDGTLRERMRGTRAEGRVRAKTGTLTGASALSGYLESRDGDTIVFSVMMNDFTCDVRRMRRLQDQICIALAEWDGSGGRP